MIKAATTLEITGGILVGHDGSPAAAESVRWAAGLAGRLGTPLHVVRCLVDLDGAHGRRRRPTATCRR